MYKHLMFLLIISTGLMINAQTVNLRGKVVDKAGNGVSNAILTLAVQGLKDTTGADGAFSISRHGVGIAKPISPSNELIMMDKGMLELTLSHPSLVKVEMYDVSGILLKKEVMRKAPAGIFRMNLAASPFAEKLLVINATIGSRSMTFRYLPINSGKFNVSPAVEGDRRHNSGFAKVAAVIDTLKVSSNGFKPVSFAISSLDTTINITLDSAGENGSTGSIGCGKDLGSLKSGTYTITSAGLSRQYILDIPANYDKNKPYRLIFGMHCFGSNMQGVANDKYYQLKRFADSTKTPCIFVAPNGVVTDGNAMWNQAEKDHTFFDDLLKLSKEKLCVDTARVFSCGFSYGAMFTNALSLTHQKQLRAVACYAPANWNIYLPDNIHEPIAYMSITGNSDPNCPFVKDDANKQGGKYCVLTHAEDNGCTIPASIPTEKSGSRKHSVFEFQGCKEGYPVKFYSFDGAHQAGPMDGVSGDNSSKSWVPGETWKFFMQF